MNPLLKYAPITEIYDGEERIIVPELPKLDVEIISESGGSEISAKVDNIKSRLCNIEDLFYTKDDEKISAAHIQGIIGERLLSLVMECYLREATKSLPEYNYGILRERERHRGKGFISMFNDKYLLRFKGDSNFVILQKDPAANTEAMYKQEKMGFISTEIDALGFIHSPINKYLIVGEASTKKNFSINSFDKEHVNGTMKERIFDPLRSLLKDHELIYLVMSPANSLFYQNNEKQILRDSPIKLYQELLNDNITTIFIPSPQLNPSIEDIAIATTERIRFAQSIMKFIESKSY